MGLLSKAGFGLRLFFRRAVATEETPIGGAFTSGFSSGFSGGAGDASSAFSDGFSAGFGSAT